MSSKITKIDAARRQLTTAIKLFFDGGDLVSIYSLAANAWEIVDTLCSLANVDSVSNQTRGHVPDGKDLKRDYVNSPHRNFFKHADRDPHGSLENFDERSTDSIIMLGVEDYIRLNNRSPVEFQVFQLWYLATHLAKVSDASLERVSVAVESTFPGITAVSRSTQIAMGKAVLEASRTNQGLLTDPRTEVSS